MFRVAAAACLLLWFCLTMPFHPEAPIRLSGDGGAGLPADSVSLALQRSFGAWSRAAADSPAPASPEGQEEAGEGGSGSANAWLAAAIIFVLIAFLMTRRSHHHAGGSFPIRLSRERPRQLGRSGFPRSLGRDGPASRIRRFSPHRKTDSGNSDDSTH